VNATRHAGRGGALLAVLWCIIILSIVVLNFGAMVQTDLRIADKETLLRLPGMTDELAAAIVEWQATFSATAEASATAATYLPSKGEPLCTPDEILLLPGWDAVTLYGEDTNRNGILDESENDGDATPPRDNGNGILDRGLARYVLLWSRERAVAGNGAPRVDLNTASGEKLRQGIPNLTEDEAKAILYHREKKGNFEHVADLFKVVIPPAEQPKPKQSNGRGRSPPRTPNVSPITASSPSPGNVNGASGEAQPQTPQPSQQPPPDQKKQPEKPAFTKERFTPIADFCTTSSEDWLPGRINLNTALLEVLRTLGLSEDKLSAIMARREAQPFPTVAALLDVPGISQDTYTDLAEHVTVRSSQFRVESVAHLAEGAATLRDVAVLERDAGRIQILYWNEN